jgi:hypothetical protein
MEGLDELARPCASYGALGRVPIQIGCGLVIGTIVTVGGISNSYATTTHTGDQ